MSSLTRSLMPSASVCSQPNLPPTRVGPRRSWMRPATLRSSQTQNTAETSMKADEHPGRHQSEESVPDVQESEKRRQHDTGSSRGVLWSKSEASVTVWLRSEPGKDAITKLIVAFARRGSPFAERKATISRRVWRHRLAAFAKSIDRWGTLSPPRPDCLPSDTPLSAIRN